MFDKLKQLKLLEGRACGGKAQSFKYPGRREAIDGNTAVVLCEREASDAAGAYPITPSTQMGEYWAEAASAGHVNISGRPLIFIEPESEHAAAGITAGMSMTGLRATNFSSGQGVAFMHESLYAAVGKRLPYVLNMGCRAITKSTLNVHCGHDDYHCVDDSGFIQVMAKSAQEAADLNVIARKTAELALTPAVVGQDGFLTTHLIESVRVPERELIAEFLGRPDDIIDTPTAAQRMIYGEKRRRVPAIWDVDNPMVSGAVQNQDAYMQAVAAQRPYFFGHIEALADGCMEEYYELTGRRYRRLDTYRIEDAEYVILGMGSMIVQAEAVADYLREARRLKVGVVNITMYRPFPGDLLGHVLKAKKGLAVLERTDQPLAEDLPLMREVRAALTKCLENGASAKPDLYPNYAAYIAAADMPSLYSGCYGLGSRDLQPEALVGAVENMLPGGARRRFFYLSVDFVREQTLSPKDEIHNQDLLEAYPAIRELAVRGSENPNLMPKGAITVRMHSIGGWGAITTGKNLAVTLFDLLGYDIKANPKYGSEKKGQPTTYYLSAAPEPIRVNCEYHYVDVVISPDPNVFGHSNPLSGLKKGGVFIIQSSLDSPQAVWASFPMSAQKFIADNDIRVFYLDGFSIARQEATSADLQLRMQGIAFQGAFFAASPVIGQSGLTEEKLFKSIEEQLLSKFGTKGKRVVEDNLRVVKRGFTELREITEKPLGVTPQKLAPRRDAGLPLMLKRMPEAESRVSDVHRFWEQTASFYSSGKGSDNLADPFIGLSLIPAATGVFRDMTQIRFEHPVWVAENCTACGKCYVACPDSAIPGLVSSIADVFNSAVTRIETGGKPTRFLRRALRTTEKKLRTLTEAAGETANVSALLAQAIDQTIAEAAKDEREKLGEEFGLFRAELGEFDFALTKPYWSAREKKTKGSGGLFSITINPYTCKGCELCVRVCEDEALEMIPQTTDSVERLRRMWNLWLDLPTTPQDYSRIADLDEKIGALDTLLLDKRNYCSLNCGDGACLGCGEKTAVHLFTATVTALMQPRVKAYVERIDALIGALEKHIRMKLTENLDLTDTEAMIQAADAHRGDDLTVAKFATHLSHSKPTTPPLDPAWVRWVSQVLEKLRRLRWQYLEGPSKRGRAEMGIINATGCTSIWGSTFPYSPYPFPWSSHLFQDSPSVAMGVFEGHMTKMAEGFKAVRMAELELAGEYNPTIHEPFFSRFDWHQFSEEEWRLCPPVTAIGGDGAMYDIGFQNLSRALISGMPIKVVVADTQVYSNTGGQACTSGFIGQVSDMAAYGAAKSGKQEMRKEISLLGMAHRTAYVMQGTVANVNHLLEGYIDGLNSRRPALFNIYTSCPVEHGIANDAMVKQSKLAVESRAYPLVKYDPDAGTTFSECLSLESNPALEEDWPTYTLKYLDEESKEGVMSLPLTFADFAATEGRFSKQFKKAPAESWNDDMLPLAEFLKLAPGERPGRFPFIWALDEKNRLARLLVSKELVESTQERLAFWRQLKNVAGLDRSAVDEEAIASHARSELLQRLAAGATALIGTGGCVPVPTLVPSVAPADASVTAQVYEPVWIETPECTACDECINLAPKAFAYNERRQAVVINPKGAKFADLVKAAEKCTAGILHPGTPWDPNEPALEGLKTRAARFN